MIYFDYHNDDDDLVEGVLNITRIEKFVHCMITTPDGNIPITLVTDSRWESTCCCFPEDGESAILPHDLSDENKIVDALWLKSSPENLYITAPALVELSTELPECFVAGSDRIRKA